MSENIHPDGKPEWTGKQKQGPHPIPDGTVSVELLNLERETADRIGSDNERLRERVAELEAREAVLEGILRSVQDCIVRADGLPHALRLITEALVNRRARG